MTTQHLNLLDARLLPRALPFSAPQTLLATVAVALITWGGAFALQTLGIDETARLQALAPKPATADPGPTVDLAALQAELQQLQDTDVAQRQLQDGLSLGGGRAQRSRSAVFKALARRANGSLWITGFNVSADGEAIDLEGRMVDASVFPAYLRQINQEPPFAGRPFAQLQISTVESTDADAGPRLTAFALRSQPAETGDRP